MNQRRATLVVLSIVLLAAGCGTSAGPTDTPVPSASPAPYPFQGECSQCNSPPDIVLARSDLPRAPADPQAAEGAAAAVNSFGLDLYRRVGAEAGNLVVSPVSIAIALAMTRAGARGETADEMDAVLHAGAAGDLAAAFNALDQELASRSGTVDLGDGNTAEVILRIANSLFAQRDLPFEEPFLATLAEYYAAGVHLVDYERDPEAARKLINGWISEQTAERIPEILGPGDVDEGTRLAIANAIYLKAPWMTPFEKDATQPGAFTRADGSTVEVPMMSGGGMMAYGEGKGWRAAELPFAGDGLGLWVIVPDDLAAFESSLTAGQLADMAGSLGFRQVNLSMPKFGIETKASLRDLLSALGMPLAFDPDRADFSGMTAAERLFISAVIHQANIDVDENGTEAAAATVVTMAATGAVEPARLVVDRPFLFALRDRPTGAILFLGRVVDPASN